MSSRLQRCVTDAVDWINEHQRLPARLEYRAKIQGLPSLTTEEAKENSIARSLDTLRKKDRKGELPGSAASQLEEVRMLDLYYIGPEKGTDHHVEVLGLKYYPCMTENTTNVCPD